MTQKNSGSNGLTERQIFAINRVETYLRCCTLLIEVGDFERAHEMTNAADIFIIQLRKVMHERRGAAREIVERTVSYYEAWYLACSGRIEVLKGHFPSGHGINKLQTARHVAEWLSDEYMQNADYKQLVKTIMAWQAEAEQRKIERGQHD